MVDKNNTHLLLTVAICTYNRSDYLADTLADLRKQNYEADDVEILVVNNNSTDTTDTVVLGFGFPKPNLPLRLIREIKQGLSHARNRALEDSSAEFVLYIDDDVFLPVSFIETWVNFIHHIRRNSSPQTELYAAGAPIEVHFDAGRPSWFPMVLSQMLGYHRLPDAAKKYPSAGYPHGGNMLLHRQTALEAGGFNTQIGRTGQILSAGEEKDFFKRLRKQGHVVHYNKESSLKHRIGAARMTKTYIRRQAIGIGSSDRLREEVGTFSWILLQILKLGISLPLAAWYLIRFRPGRALTLVQFRIWVLKGFLSPEFNSGFEKKGAS